MSRHMISLMNVGLEVVKIGWGKHQKHGNKSSGGRAVRQYIMTGKYNRHMFNNLDCS